MKIVFFWDWEPHYYQSLTWQDGASAAVKELIRRGHDITVVTVGEDNTVKHPYFDITVSSKPVELIKQIKPDVILHWADMTRPHARPLFELGIPMAICFAGGEPLGQNYPFFQHVFVESEVYRQKFEEAEVSVSIAFGTNTDLFKPIPEQPKLFDTIFPATFAWWKRHDLYAQATEGLRSVAVGHRQPNEIDAESWQECEKRGVMLLPHASGDMMRYLYAASKVCVITSSSAGGSQRTVLEALSMNLPLVVTDSDKFDCIKGIPHYKAAPNPENLRRVIETALQERQNTREYVLDQWSEFTYADSLERGLKSIL